MSDLISNALTTTSHNNLKVKSVNKVPDALERIGKGGVRSVIMDIEVPSGFARFEELLSVAPHIPILILSGTETECIARQAVEQGAQDYMLKNQLEEFRLKRVVRSMIALKSKEDAAIQQLERADVILSCTGDAVLISDADGFVRHLNEPAELLTGWSCQEAMGRSLGEVFQTIDPISRQAIVDPLATAAVSKKYVPLCSNCVLVQRHGFEVAIGGSAAYTRDRVGNINGSIFVFNDISAARAKSLELSHLAQHDFLTDLPNRVLLNDRITQAISFAARYSKQLAVMFLDLDGFKSINDSLGHTIGDKLLQLAAGRLVACVRRSDTVSRLGGDEFVVLLYQVEHAEDAAFISKKILSSLAEPFSIEQKHLDISASIGVSTYPGDGQDAETLIHKADTAMYAAKKLGRNNCQFFKAEMQARLLERQRLEGSLRHALYRNEFTLRYQPKIDLKTGEITGVEACSLETPHARNDPAAAICTNRRRDRIDRAYRSVGASPSLPAVACLDGCGTSSCAYGRQRVRSGVHGQGFLVGSSCRADFDRCGPSQFRAGADRNCADARRRVRCKDSARAESHRGATCRGRFWHRVLELQLSATISAGRFED